MRLLIAPVALAILLMPGPASAGRACTSQGHQYPDGTALRAAVACSGLTCRVVRCHDGNWGHPVESCRLDVDCPITERR